MGQLFIVQGPEDEVGAAMAAGLVLFRALHGLTPSKGVRYMCFAGAEFPPEKAPLRDDPPGGKAADGWIAAAGFPFYKGMSGRPALDAVHNRLRRQDYKCSDDLDGIFAIACFDPQTEELVILTDLLATLHVYRARLGGCVVLSTSSMVLAAMQPTEWDLLSCREFLATGTVFETRTLFQRIEKLKPASMLRFRRGEELASSIYWHSADFMYDRAPERGDAESLAGALEEVFRTLASNLPNAVLDLTGGFDSRALLGAMLKVGAGFSTTVCGSQADPDVVVSTEIARRFGVSHAICNPSAESDSAWWSNAKAALPLCDGEYDVLLYARVLAVHRSLASRFDATINGSNGEICKGYWWELLFPHTGARGHFDALLVGRKRFAFAGDPGLELLNAQFPQALDQHFADVINRANTPFGDHPNTAKMDNVYMTLRMQRWQGRIASATSRIWPCVSPFMFRRPMEIALSAPPRVRARHRMSRRLLEQFGLELAAIPLANGYPASPLRLTTAYSFTPMAIDMVRKSWQRFSVRPSRVPAYSGGHVHPLWGEEEVADILHWKSMNTLKLYKPEQLRSFLQVSQTLGTQVEGLFGRVLTLELLSKALASGRQEISCLSGRFSETPIDWRSV